MATGVCERNKDGEKEETTTEITRGGSRSLKIKLTRCPNVRRAISEPISSPMAMRAMPRTATPWEENERDEVIPLAKKQTQTTGVKPSLPDGSPYQTPSCPCPSCPSSPCRPPFPSPWLRSARCRCAEAAAPSAHSQSLRRRR